MKNQSLFFVPAIFLSPLLPAQTETAVPAPVDIRKDTVILPTYLVDDPDRIPRFYEGRAYQGAQGKVYPYPINESLSDTRVERGYEMICLENDYIRVELLTELG